MKFVAKMTDFPQYLGNSGTLCLLEVGVTRWQIQVNKYHNLCNLCNVWYSIWYITKCIDLICLLYRSCEFTMRSEGAYGSKEGFSLSCLLWSYGYCSALFESPSSVDARLVKSFVTYEFYIFFTFQSLSLYFKYCALKYLN